MKLEMSKTKRTLALIAILFSNVCVMADLAITPVIGQIYGYYPDNINGVNYIVSGPMLVLVVASLATPLLFQVMDKKIVFIIGSVFFAVGAVFGVLTDQIFYVCATRTLVGIGEGMVNVVGVAYISDLYEDQKDRARINGFYSAAMSLAGMVFSYFGGILGTSGWLNTYKIYYVTAIPMLILVILFIPGVKTKAGQAQKDIKKGTEKKEKLGWKYWEMSFCFLVMNIALGATVLYYISTYVIEMGIGDSVVSGYAASLKSLFGFLIGLGFGWIMGKLKRWTITLSYLIAGVTILLMIFMPSTWMLYIIGTIAGLTYKIAMPFNYSHSYEIVPASRTDDAVSITTAVYGLGSFLSTYCAGWLVQGMKSETYTGTWTIWAVIMLALFVIDVIAVLKEKSEAR